MTSPPCHCERLPFPHRLDWMCDAFADRDLDKPMHRDEKLSELVRNLAPVGAATEERYECS